MVMSEYPKRVLLAEDNLAIGKVLEFNLRRAGFDVTHVQDGTLAVEAAAQNRFDLIITDYQMPGKTGEELCRSIRQGETNQATPVALCTAKGHEIDAAAMQREFGILKSFSKPFSPSEVVDFAVSVLQPQRVET